MSALSQLRWAEAVCGTTRIKSYTRAESRSSRFSCQNNDFHSVVSIDQLEYLSELFNDIVIDDISPEDSWKSGTLLNHWTRLLFGSVNPDSDYGIVTVDKNVFKAQILIVRSSHGIKEDKSCEIGIVWSHDQKDQLGPLCCLPVALEKVVYATLTDWPPKFHRKTLPYTSAIIDNCAIACPISYGFWLF